MSTNGQKYWVGFDKDGVFVEDCLIRHARAGYVWLWSERAKTFDDYPEQYAKPRLKALNKSEEQNAIAAYLQWLEEPKAQQWQQRRIDFLESPTGKEESKKNQDKIEAAQCTEAKRHELERRFALFYHMTHVNNIEGICRHGLLSLSKVRGQNLSFKDISDPGAQRWRDRRETVYGRPIHDYVPFYLNPKNPMQFRRREMLQELVLVEVHRSVLAGREYVYSDGNAASRATRFSDDVLLIGTCVEALTAEYWTEIEDGKRRRCAEVLIYSHIEPRSINRLICMNDQMVERLMAFVGLPVVADRTLFF
jgi:hypothetical protein